MKNIKEVEYCDFQLTFQKKQAFELIGSIVGNQYSSVENSGYMIIYVYLDNEAVKLKFKKRGSHIQLIGKSYCFQSEIIVGIMEKLIGENRGNVTIKRFGHDSIYIENIVFGETVMITEINGNHKKILYQKKQVVNSIDIEKTWLSKGVEERIAIWKLESDYALAWLAEGLEKKDKRIINKYKKELQRLHQQRIGMEF